MKRVGGGGPWKGGFRKSSPCTDIFYYTDMSCYVGGAPPSKKSAYGTLLTVSVVNDTDVYYSAL